MKLKFTVTDLDGNARDVIAGFSQQIRYEEVSGKTVTSWRENPPGVRDWALLAWISETAEMTSFRDWTDNVSMVLLAGVVEVDPTKVGAASTPQ